VYGGGRKRRERREKTGGEDKDKIGLHCTALHCTATEGRLMIDNFDN
jgi:hypothetical protein